VRILDFGHGAQRLGDVAEAVWGAGETGAAWAAAQQAELRDGTAEAVLTAIRAVPLAAAPDPAAASRVQGEVLGYLEPRVEQMRYARFRAAGLPIGSGIVESANKHLVKARLGGAGRRWTSTNITPLLALRGALASERWDEAWAAIATARRQATAPDRVPRPPTVVPVAASAASVALPTTPRPQPVSLAIPRAGPKTIVNGRPTARHPWHRYRVVPPPAPANL
jgi:hypothetical protein